jgi:enoyl-CoA hydratase/carnithine racemase
MEQPQSCWQQNNNLVGTLEKALSWLRSSAEDVKANARELFLIRGTNQFLRLHNELWDSVASISRTWWRGNRLDAYSNGEGLALEASYFGLCSATEDKKEGTSAFLEKRAPQFHGR